MNLRINRKLHSFSTFNCFTSIEHASKSKNKNHLINNETYLSSLSLEPSYTLLSPLGSHFAKFDLK